MYPLKTENTFLLREIFVFFSKVILGYILRVNYTCLATTGSLKAMPRCPLPPHFIPEPPLPRCLVSSLFSPLPLFHFSTFSFRKHKKTTSISCALAPYGTFTALLGPPKGLILAPKDYLHLCRYLRFFSFR